MNPYQDGETERATVVLNHARMSWIAEDRSFVVDFPDGGSGQLCPRAIRAAEQLASRTFEQGRPVRSEQHA